jgi:hypothetical protein
MSDPEMFRAVAMLTLALLSSDDPAKRMEGKRFCEELLKSSNRTLTNIARLRLSQMGQLIGHQDAGGTRGK